MSKNDKTELEIEDIYKSLTDQEHILKLPDTWIGGIQEDDIKMWVFDDEKKRMVYKSIKYIPGLYKIFDEIIVNARDQVTKDPTCTDIKVSITKDNGGTITVWNNGDDGIPVVFHKIEKCYVPEMIFGKLRTSSHYDQTKKITGGKNGIGSKCNASNTMVTTFEGTKKRCGNLTINDKLIGDDGKIRNIKKIITGKGPMYKISQSKGESYEVNDQHILTLHMPDHKVIFWNNSCNGWSVLWWDTETNSICSKKFCSKVDPTNCPECGIELAGNMGRHYRRLHPNLTIPKLPRKSPTTIAPDTDEAKENYKKAEEFCKTIDDNSTFDMCIQDYMKLSDTTKSRLAGVRGSCVQWPKKEVSFDPYILGLWMGDGDSDGYGYTCYGEKDPEIIDYLTEWGKDNNITVIKRDKYHYSFSSDKNKSPIKNYLKKYNLINNKHIPIDYIVNDRDTRLKVLAGMIDTDGTVQNDGTRVVITQCFAHKKIVDGIVLLARSLGFYCALTIKKTSWMHNGVKKTGEAYNINISGDIEDIPTRLPRKKCANIRVESSKSTGQIKIEDIGEGDYVGIEIDSNQRFVINDFTVTHNCVNIFSNTFIVDVIDAKNKLSFHQRFYNNMYGRDEPKIIELKGKQKSSTQITFAPDYKRFEVECLSDDMISLFKKRVYDIAAITNVKVSLNDEVITVNNFEQYMNMFYEDGEIPNPPVYCDSNERWKVGVVYDPNPGHRQISYVNGICTFQGGSHVNHVADHIVGKLHDLISSKNKNLKIKTGSIKDNLTFFVDSIIEDPQFNSQTKEFLSTKTSNFGSKFEVGNDFIVKLAKTGIVDEVINFAKFRAMEDLKKTDGKKKQSLKGLAKLDDAHWAATRKSKYCTLILTEGDSAKSFAVAGTEVIGKDRYGVFPLRGKLLNVREATPKQLIENEEIKNIKQIMGLKHGKVYKDVSQLRYGRILILTDQDYDGSHIKGLIMNFIHFFWPSLIQMKGFITCIKTPIIKVWKKTDVKKTNTTIFYTITEYNTWKEEVGDKIKTFNVKYYKGLGTSTDEEAKEAFTDFEKKLIEYIWNKEDQEIKIENENADENDAEEDNDDSDDDGYENMDKTHECYDALTLAFSKTRTHDRKKWLEKYDPETIIDGNEQLITYNEFINKDLIHFSNYDNIRSIPSVCDGFKPSLRKILFGCILRRIFNEEIRVSQLSGFVSDKSGYHHGEVSLQGAIIGMAQNFVGSNNLNLLLPNGNFGNRRVGGKNAASARYIYTQLNELIQLIFRKEDDCVLEFVDDDGTLVEPKTYAPIINMELINGFTGIGTGFSTYGACHNPLDVIHNIRQLINGGTLKNMTPHYKGHKGKIVKISETKFESYGNYDIINENTILIDELPIETWTENYKAYLDSLVADDEKNPKKGQILKSFQDDCGNNTIKFTLTFLNGALQELVKKKEIESKLKLINKHSMSNMHLYDANGIIKKYNTVNEIYEDYYKYRHAMYTKRKEHYLKVLENQLTIIGWKIKFLDDVINGTIIVIDFETKKTRTKANVIQQLKYHNYPVLSHNPFAFEDDKSHDYLLGIKIFDLTDEERAKTKEEYNKKFNEHDIYKNTTVENIWLNELDELEIAYRKWIINNEDIDDKPEKKKGKGKAPRKRAVKMDI